MKVFRGNAREIVSYRKLIIFNTNIRNCQQIHFDKFGRNINTLLKSLILIEEQLNNVQIFKIYIQIQNNEI